MNKIQKYYYNILKKTEYKDVNYDRLIMRGGYEFPNATDAELEDALDWAGSKVYYKRGFLAKELLKIAKSLLAYRGGPIKDKNFVRDISKLIQNYANEDDTEHELGGSYYGEDESFSHAFGIERRYSVYIEDVDDAYIKIPLKKLYKYSDLPMKEFSYRLKSELKKIVKEINNKNGVSLYVKLSGVEDLEIGLEDLWIADAKIRGSNLVLEISGQEIGNEAGTQSDVERHLQEAYDPY
jgi:hypothetical protein